MKIGFTGTRLGMSARQKVEFLRLLNELIPSELHHGDDSGADQEAHLITDIHLRSCNIIVHPPMNEYHRAFCKGHTVMPQRPFLVRNRAIVKACDQLIAAPRSMEEELRSGTWSTVRYAREENKPVILLPR